MLSSALPHIRTGKVRVLAVGSEKRHPALAEVPAVEEMLPGFASANWFGMAATDAKAKGTSWTTAVAGGIDSLRSEMEVARDERDALKASLELLRTQIQSEKDRLIKALG